MLQFFALLCLVISAGSIWFALEQPWLGVTLRAEGDRVAIVEAKLPVRVPEGAVAERLAGAASETLRGVDVLEDPDLLRTYAAIDAFFARQDRLAGLLRGGGVSVEWSSAGSNGAFPVAGRTRPAADLPGVFWFQIATGLIGFVIAAWVYLLRPADLAARMFLITGLGLFLAAEAAAIYDTRELALPAAAFSLLSFLNHAGAITFGCAFVALFASYPRRLVPSRYLLWLPAVFLPWLAVDTLHLAPDPAIGNRLPCLLQLLLALAAGVAQWHASRNQPLDRAALRWLTLSALLGCGLVTLNSIVPHLLGLATPIPQGYAFGFFLIMYLGIALGLGRYRLFDLDEWAYRILIWLAGAFAVILCDALLLYVGFTDKLSLGLSLLLCGGLYFPFRQWLWQRLVSRNTSSSSFEALLPQVSSIAFLPSPGAQDAAWGELLKRLFAPLDIAPVLLAGATAGVRDDGLALYVPSCRALTPRLLRYAGHGRRLFSSRDAAFAATLCQAMEQIMAGRVSYEQGVQQERLRIGRDLHDNIGARLLKLIHHLRGSSAADLAREAMKDLRTAIAAIDGKPMPLVDALADWHAEAEGRCDLVGARLEWAQGAIPHETLLQPRARAMLESVLRELVTNALKHAAPGALNVQVEADGAGVCLRVENDGHIADPAEWQAGYGLRNVRGRLAEFGGSLAIERTPVGVSLLIVTPLVSPS